MEECLIYMYMYLCKILKVQYYMWFVHTCTPRKLGYDILGESSPVPSNVLCPAEKLQWKISTETAKDIQTAKKNIDQYVEWMYHRWSLLLILLMLFSLCQSGWRCWPSADDLQWFWKRCSKDVQAVSRWFHPDGHTASLLQVRTGV